MQSYQLGIYRVKEREVCLTQYLSVMVDQCSLTHTHSELCVASAVFGVGKDYYTTEKVTSNDPEWNQEARMYALKY